MEKIAPAAAQRLACLASTSCWMYQRSSHLGVPPVDKGVL
jgi:hypothetical protein